MSFQPEIAGIEAPEDVLVGCAPECTRTKKTAAISRAGRSTFPMMSVCRCFARRVKFDEKAANPVRRIRTAFAICVAANEPRVYRGGLKILAMMSLCACFARRVKF